MAAHRVADTRPAHDRTTAAVAGPGSGPAGLVPVVIVSAAFAASAASLALPAVLGYDPWAWLGWGRAVTRGTLSTQGGPTWKPLPVLVTAALAYFGDAAPQLWLFLARAGGLLAMIMAFRLAARFAGPVAGVVAVATLLLTPDHEARWIRHLLQGNVEPLTVGLCLWAVARHLDHRRGHAVVLLGLAALLRPEVWPILAPYAGWVLWPERRRARSAADPDAGRSARWAVAVAVLVAVPLLWFGGDWLASGDPWSGADRAQVLLGSAAERLGFALEQVGNAVIAPVWVAAAACVVWAVDRRQPAPVVLAGAALTWMAAVVAMAGLFGYAALGRFLAPPAAVLCVLAGIGVGRAVRAVNGLRARLAVAMVVVIAAVPFAVARVEWLPRQLAAAADRAWLEDDLDRAVAVAGGRDGVLACGLLAVDSAPAALEARPALSWKLDVPLVAVGYDLGVAPGVVIALAGGALDGALSPLPAPDVRTLARTAGWAVFALRCPVQ